jgi:hypothetical protein
VLVVVVSAGHDLVSAGWVPWFGRRMDVGRVPGCNKIRQRHDSIDPQSNAKLKRRTRVACNLA